MSDIYEGPSGTLNHRETGRKAKIDEVYPDPAAWYPSHRVVTLLDPLGGIVAVEEYRTERGALGFAERFFATGKASC